MKNCRIYLTQNQRQDNDPPSVLLQTLCHYVLGHETPRNYGDFLAQRVATNYLAAALLLQEQAIVEFFANSQNRQGNRGGGHPGPVRSKPCAALIIS